MKKIVILTGSELRHTFFRKYISMSDEIKVLGCYCEGTEKSLHAIIKEETNNILRARHLAARTQSEIDFFEPFVKYIPDHSNPVFIPKGKINSSEHTKAIIDANPDLLIAYGCSIIKEPLLSAFKGCFLNVHLGLSPYYRGAGTNYWPLVNNEPEYVGATFMHIDAGIDTGEIIHQTRAKIIWGDMPVQIGNRLIGKMSRVYRDIIVNFDDLKKMSQLKRAVSKKVYKIKDYSEESVAVLYENFQNGLVEKYIVEKINGCMKVPIIENPIIKG
jgi:methionyl-tRNA formyltransferase